MSEAASQQAEIKVGAHVLVQLGSELVTDVEQAILECVKNAYDADSVGCRIDIYTREIGEQNETFTAETIRGFDKPTDTVEVQLQTTTGERLTSATVLDIGELVTRRIHYTGRISIEDTGDGLTPEQLRSSWLVISRSGKRGERGAAKQKTKKGRTPLGDKGLGRLGSMKLGDVLRIETATSPFCPLAIAQFRWADCDSAKTVDQIPVFTEEIPNVEKFKGTRVSVLGLHDLPEWRRKDRINEITRSLARLISPFEATSTFPVGITLDGVNHSLVSVTDDALKRAVAEFEFSWQQDEAAPSRHILVAKARFRKRLFTSRRSGKAKQRTERIFDQDQGAGFATYLDTYSRLKPYKKAMGVAAPWYVELERTFQWSDMQLDSGAAITDPGLFQGAFYFFHLDSLDLDGDKSATEGTEAADIDTASAAGIGVDRQLIRDMTGISILRDGFRVRSQGDWLGLSMAMTSGSTYGMRPDNTVGYFALTGAENYRLVEKSDREGFVEDAAYRGFLQIAMHCRSFANESLEQVRRALDEYYKQLTIGDAPAPPTVGSSFQMLESGLQLTEEARTEAEQLAAKLKVDIDRLEQDTASDLVSSASTQQALELANSAMTAVRTMQAKLSTGSRAGINLLRLRQTFDERDEQTRALFESAAVGLSARGLAHEVRTHLTEIRQRTAVIEKASKNDKAAVLPHLRAIRASCSAISSAAALIDPMLPRSRSIKETMSLKSFVEEYFASRESLFLSSGIAYDVFGGDVSVRVNRPRLTQVLDNLVRNSMYWLRRGEMTGEIRRKKSISVEVTTWGFVVSDTGPGVDPHYESSLFEMFVTGKPEKDTGQGLGLFIITELLSIDGCDLALLPDRNQDGRRFRFAVNLLPVVVSA